jgi:two-component system response regulator HupR/HoxA
MKQVLAQVRLVAPHRMVVLLHGETGTGKEVLARAIHRLSERAHAPFVVQDCGALPETLLDSELFGHVRGSFTGAQLDHAGLFTMADGGTIFLDEIENTSPALQAKLLRVIETGEVRPVGGTRVRQVDARLICATNRDLEDEVRAGRFRSDLYYRLSTFPIDVPPLRHRPADILPLAQGFITAFAAQLGHDPRGLEDDAEAAVLSYTWPGNARELRNALERAVLLARGRPITAAHLPDAVRHRVPILTTPPAVPRPALASQTAPAPQPAPELPGSTTGIRARLAELESELLAAALRENGGVIRRAARALGMNRVTFARRARKHGL